jgi:hypothetical protein
MKRPLLSSLLFATGLLAASRPALAAAPKADARTIELVAALQAVSPDPLGGRLGLAAATVQAAPAAPAKDNRRVASQSVLIDHDQRAYLLWKSSQKS